MRTCEVLAHIGYLLEGMSAGILFFCEFLKISVLPLFVGSRWYVIHLFGNIGDIVGIFCVSLMVRLELVADGTSEYSLGISSEEVSEERAFFFCVCWRRQLRGRGFLIFLLLDCFYLRPPEPPSSSQSVTSFRGRESREPLPLPPFLILVGSFRGKDPLVLFW